MPELIFPPANHAWPPPGAGDPRVTRYPVARVGTAGESFQDICNRFGIRFEDLMAFNFGLSRDEPKYFEKINWYLKHKLGCRKTTPQGNFIFSGGETIYIPPRGQVFDEVSVVGTAKERRVSLRRTTKDERTGAHWTDFLQGTEPGSRSADKGWKMFYGPKGSDASNAAKAIADSTENVLFQQDIEVPKAHVLLRVAVDTLLDFKGLAISPTPGETVKLAGNLTTRRREFFYGPGEPDQPVTIFETIRATNSDGSTRVVRTVTRHEPQPKNYNY